MACHEDKLRVIAPTVKAGCFPVARRKGLEEGDA
jgi:hypothetical protein